MSPPESTPNATEQASWLSSPEPKKMQSLKRYISTRIDILFDGAYFWFNGEPILVPEFDSELNAWKIITNKPSRGKIITINPGAKKVSKLLPMSREGNSLALLQSRWGYEKLNHIEAENEKLIREVDYAEIFRYLGEDHLVRIMAWYGAFSNFLEKLIPWMKDLPSSAYQVTKKWQENGLLLVNEKHRPSWRTPFLGGPGSFKQRERATSH